MKRYDEFSSVEELLEAYNMKSLSSFLLEDDKSNQADVEKKIDKKDKKRLKKMDEDKPTKVVKKTNLKLFMLNQQRSIIIYLSTF